MARIGMDFAHTIKSYARTKCTTLSAESAMLRSESGCQSSPSTVKPQFMRSSALLDVPAQDSQFSGVTQSAGLPRSRPTAARPMLSRKVRSDST